MNSVSGKKALYRSLYFQVITAIIIGVILGIDRFMSEARALTNLVGNGVATIVVAKWTGDLDTEQLQRELDAGPGHH